MAKFSLINKEHYQLVTNPELLTNPITKDIDYPITITFSILIMPSKDQDQIIKKLLDTSKEGVNK